MFKYTNFITKFQFFQVILGLLLVCLIASIQAATTYQLVYTITKQYVDNDDNTIIESSADNGSQINNVGKIVNEILINNSTQNNRNNN